jgi:hypothetical protein
MGSRFQSGGNGLPSWYNDFETARSCVFITPGWPGLCHTDLQLRNRGQNLARQARLRLE